MLISFDGINFNWEIENGINRLIITCSDIGNTDVIQKEDYKHPHFEVRVHVHHEFYTVSAQKLANSC